MAKKIRFPLKMKNGAEIRTLDELKRNFDLESVLGYYANGKLETWLSDRYYDVEATKVAELDPDSESFMVKLCEILGVSYIENPNEETDLDYINRRNEKKTVLSQLTDGVELLNNIDSVALNQDDLLDCYDMGLSKIYLVGDTVFSIPVSVTNVTYIGRCGAKAEIRATYNVDFKEKNINFEGISFIGDIKPETPNVNEDVHVNKSVDYNIPECDGTNFKELFELAKGGNVSAQFEIGKFLYEHHGERKVAMYWLKKAIDANYSKALYYWAELDRKENGKKYMLMAAKNGYVPAQYMMSRIYGIDYYMYNCKRNEGQAYEWLKKAAEKGHIIAQSELGSLLYDSHNIFGIRKRDEAVMWLTKAAEQDDVPACRELGNIFYKEGDKEKAKEYYEKAVQYGDSMSEKRLKDLKEGKSYISSSLLINIK